MDLLYKLQMSECLNMFLSFLRGVVKPSQVPQSLQQGHPVDTVS